MLPACVMVLCYALQDGSSHHLHLVNTPCAVHISTMLVGLADGSDQGPALPAA